jgi:hypothetical protein
MQASPRPVLTHFDLYAPLLLARQWHDRFVLRSFAVPSAIVPFSLRHSEASDFNGVVSGAFDRCIRDGTGR